MQNIKLRGFPIKTRPLLGADKACLLRLLKSTGRQRGLSSSLTNSLGLEINQELVAVILAIDCVEALEIDYLMTCPKFQRQGLMDGLLREFILKAKKKIWLEVHEKNESAIRLYKKHGFRASGKRSKYYPDGGSAILMELNVHEAVESSKAPNQQK